MINQCSYSCNTLGLVKQHIYLFIRFESRAPKVVAELGKEVESRDMNHEMLHFPSSTT